MIATGRRLRLRQLLNGNECVFPASVYDPVSARAAESLGFECALLAGSVASWAILGAPDKTLITLTELASLAGRISRATQLPLLIDADHGYGNALNVMRTVEELESAGVAGLTIEDTLLPAPYGKTGKAGLIPLEEGIGKVRAALAARVDPSLAIIGRTMLGLVPLEEVILRAKAYADAGVDAIFVSGLKQEAELTALAAAVKLPFLLGATAPELMNNRALLGSYRVRFCAQGHQAFWAAAQGAYQTLSALRSGAPPASLTGVTPQNRISQWTHADEYARAEAAFLAAGKK